MGAAAAPAAAATAPFDVTAYLKAHPEVVEAYVSSPDYASMYGSLVNFAATNALRNGTPAEQQAIQAGNFTLPNGTSAKLVNNGQSDANSANNVNVTFSGGLGDDAVLPSLGYQQAPSSPGFTNQPIEQTLLNSALPNIAADANNPAYANLAATLLKQLQSGASGLTSTLQQAQGGGQIDPAGVLRDAPNLANLWSGSDQGSSADTRLINVNGTPTEMTLNQFATWWYQTFGASQVASGQIPPMPDAVTQSPLLQQANAAAGQAAATQTDAAKQSAQDQVAALTQAINSMQGNLTGALAQQSQALQQNLQALTQSINTYGSTASQALTTQINQQLANLQQSISSQKDALAQQIASLQGANTAEAQQKQAALQTELTKLNAAEAPVAAARTAAAQAQITAVNIGRQQTMNAIRAQDAQKGFLGDSTMTNNALEQANVAAEQAGANALGGATLQNAQDYQGIGNFGATTGAGIENTAAEQGYGIDTQGAQGQYNLANALAQGTQGLQDTGAAGQASITNNVAQQLEGAQQGNANTAYQNANTGITQQYNLANTLASGLGNIGTNLATQQQGITNTLAQQQQQNQANQYNNAVAAGSALTALPGTIAGQVQPISNVANTGIINDQNLLNWWATQANPPTPTASVSTAPTTGNSIANAGSGLLNLAGTIWSNTKTPAVNPAKTTPTAIPTLSGTIGPG